MLAPHGDRLLDLCRGASNTVLIVAPFIKDHVLARVFAALPPTVGTVTCITRWFPEEVAAGVSDLEIFDRLSGHPGGRLLLHPHLHAKLYRADRRCLIGSANLTGRALGWSSPPNIELLVELDAEFSELAALEVQLLAAAVPVTAAMRDAVRAAADLLKAENRVPNFSDTDIDTDTLSPQVWLPACTAPDRLWNVYANHEPWQLVTSAAAAAALDLLALGPPAGLLRATFNQYIAAALKQMPLVMDIDQRAATGITDEQAVALIVGAVGTDALPYPPADMWEVLKAWLAHFFPSTYRRTAHGEVFVRGRQITS
jgi:hypothetical protein